MRREYRRMREEYKRRIVRRLSEWVVVRTWVRFERVRLSHVLMAFANIAARDAFRWNQIAMFAAVVEKV